MQTEGVEKKGICYPVHFDPAVLVEENGDEIILFQREEGSWLKMSKKLYRNICWHLEHNQEFLPEYDRILKSLNKCNILANKKQKRLENVTVMLTDKCNLACKHCCASELSSSRDISFSILGKIIELEPMQITVTGGEPLLHKNIEEILCFLRTEYEGTLVLSTNGTLVEDYLDLIFSYIDKVEVSLDGVEEENTEKYRGGGVYQRVLDAVKILRQHEMPVAMSIVSYDGRETEKFFELNRKYGTVPIIRELYLNEKVLGNIDTLIPNGKEGYIRSVKNVIKKEEGKTELALCGACSYQIFLDCEGNVYPCGGLSGDALKIGNIRDAEIFERVQNSPDVCYRTVMQRILSEEKFSKCRKCRVRSFCWNCISDILSKSMLPEVFEAYCKSSFKKWELFVWKEKERV